MRASSLIFLFALFAHSLTSQITTIDITPEEAVEALLGDNVTYSNVTYTGDPLQMGFMDGGEGTIFSVDAGVVLCTDGAADITGEFTPLSSTVSGDDDLLTIANSVPPLIGESFSVSGANDLCILEFDFVPTGDEINFNYVFGSDEYEVWVNSSFNDVFAFFLSGPGITGPYDAPAGFPDGSVNIAFVPDSDPELPITISSVNSSINSEYYIDNQSNIDLSINGFTTTFSASYTVDCGETYHIKLAIADGSDTALKSIVVLEENSFTSNPGGLTLESFFPLGLVEISEACDSGFVSLNRQCDADSVYFQLEYLVNDSTAELGVDYIALVTDTFMIPGQDILQFLIQAISDGIDEELEYICVELSQSSSSDGPFEFVGVDCIAILDNYTFPVTVNDQVLWCPEDVPSFTGVPQFPAVPPFDYEWFLDGTSVSIDNPYEPVIPAQGDTVFYDLQVTDFCGALNDSITPFVANMVPNDPVVNIATTGEYCPGVDYALTAERFGGTAPHTYTWTDEFGQAYENSQTIFVDPLLLYGPIESIGYHVLYEDNCTPTRTAEADYVVTFPDPLTTSASMTSAICTDQILELFSSADGGYPPYQYTWTSNPTLGPTAYFPIQYGFLPGAEGTAVASGFLVDEIVNPNSEYLINLEVNDWCSLESDFFLPAFDVDTVLAIDCIYPNVVSPNGDGSNDSFLVNELLNRPGTMFIYNRWGNLLVETNNNEWKIGDEPEGTYFYVVQFDDEEEDKERKGYFTIVR